MSALALSIVCLTNPRPTTNGWLAFDMYLYLKENSSPQGTATDSNDQESDDSDVTLKAIARFYNHGELRDVGEDEVLYCLVVTTVCNSPVLLW